MAATLAVHNNLLPLYGGVKEGIDTGVVAAAGCIGDLLRPECEIEGYESLDKCAVDFIVRAPYLNGTSSPDIHSDASFASPVLAALIACRVVIGSCTYVWRHISSPAAAAASVERGKQLGIASKKSSLDPLTIGEEASGIGIMVSMSKESCVRNWKVAVNTQL